MHVCPPLDPLTLMIIFLLLLLLVMQLIMQLICRWCREGSGQNAQLDYEQHEKEALVCALKELLVGVRLEQLGDQ